MATYIIHDRTEETYCKYCGQPLEVGDKVTENAAADPFCSKTCAVIHDARATKLTSEQEYDASRAQRWDNQNQSRYFDEVADTY